MQPISLDRRSRSLEFGIYRDGDNNLDAIQGLVLDQARRASAREPSVEFTVEDTTASRGDGLQTFDYRLDAGVVRGSASDPPHDMSSRANLAAFVARTLDNSESANARKTWIDLVDHGAGDGGGLEADEAHRGRMGSMSEDDIAGAIADGVALHARRHPEDASRGVDGVVANQCLMATLGFASALSHAGVRYLAASPETMLAPGVPSSVALDIAHHDDAAGMAQAIVADTMRTRYFPQEAGGGFPPAAAFDVLDLAPNGIAKMEGSVKALNAELVAAARDRSGRTAIKEDARAVRGMVRFPSGRSLPWRADRPAETLYDTFASDGRLDGNLRARAHEAAEAVRSIVLAHAENGDFAPFGHADYGDAAGPTVHFPLTARQFDPWAPQISETGNAFYRNAGGAAVAHALA